MSRKKAIDQARYITETGKMIQERVVSIIAAHTGSNGKKKGGLLELSVPQFHAVKMARKHGSLTITQMAEILKVSPPSASAMVDRLVEKGTLKRERSPKDRRKVLVSVPEKIIKDIEKIEEEVLTSFLELVEKIGPDTTAKWCEVLGEIRKVLKENEVKR